MRNRGKTTLGLALACLIIFAVTISSNLNTSAFIEDSNWMVHTIEVQNEIERLKTLMMTAQNHLRGYHVTGQDYYLHLYEEARDKMVTAFAYIRKLTLDNPGQKKQLDVVAPLLDDKLERWTRSVEIREKEGFPAIQKLMMADLNKQRDAALREAMDKLSGEEESLLAVRAAATKNQAWWSVFISWLGGTLACGLILGAAYLFLRERSQREIAEGNIDRFFTLSLDLLCISGMDGFFKRLSPSFREVLGYSLEELYRTPVVDFIHPEDIKSTVEQIARQAGGQTVLAFENRFRCKDGSFRVFSWKSVPVGELMYAVARDVTREKIVQADLIAARETAQKAARAKSEFLANMSHEIRTPLNGVVGMTDLLNLTELKPDQQNYVTGIRRSSKSLLKIVNEILDFSKIEAGQMSFEALDFELEQLVESQISLAGVIAGEKHLALDCYVDPRIPGTLRGDPGKIGQILLNLLNNAVKFTETGKITLKVEMRAFVDSQCQLFFSVQDTGIGMNPTQVEKLFAPFIQADTSTARKYGGTGLGLTISKRLVELMNGEIGVRSEIGGGSLFWFTLKLEVPAEQIAKQVPKPKAPAATAEQIERRKHVHILIAEDNPMNQMIAMKMLSSLGYTAMLARNGQEAVELYKDSRFDLILMDQHMPVLDGTEATTEIRKLEEGTGRRIPIIAFTATVIQEENRLIYQKLMDDFILKPVTLKALEATLSKWEKLALSGENSRTL
jgi:PAS domain S-box-containing protein